MIVSRNDLDAALSDLDSLDNLRLRCLGHMTAIRASECGAYEYLADNARGRRHVFAELAGAFSVMLQLVADACTAAQQLGDEDILALYQRWRSTRNPLARRQLESLGVQLQEHDSLH